MSSAVKTATRQVSVAKPYGRSSRFYQVGEDAALLPSVTNILNVIGKPALINWAANTERALVIEAAAALWEDAPITTKMTRLAYIATLTDRIGKTKAHQKELAKAGEKLWNDAKLSTNGMSCSTCHQSHGAFQKSFAKPYPHQVAMARDKAGMKTVHLDEMIQACMVMPMAAKPLPWNSRELAALTAYTQDVQKTFKPGAKAPANPCSAKPTNPCAAKPANPCAKK